MIGILDVTDWQTAIEMKTGRGTSATGILAETARKIQASHPYPGDQNPEHPQWVTDTALDLCGHYHPDLMALTYAYPSLSRFFGSPSEEEWWDIVTRTFNAIDRFVERSGYTPVIIGTGSMIPVNGRIDLSGLDCIIGTGGAAPRYAGLFDPSDADLEYVRSHPHVRSVLRREDVFGTDPFCPEAVQRFPDYLAAAEEGYVFRGMGSIARPIAHIPAFSRSIPVICEIKTPPSITGIRGMVEEQLAEKKRVALIIVEGIGAADINRPFTPANNTFRWHTYAPGEGQYAAILTGKPLPKQEYPPGFQYYPEDGEDREYPFSGYFSSIPKDTLGSSCSGRTAAVGSRSTFTHVYAGTDITIECFARNLYNYGTMAVIRRDGIAP